MSRNLVIFLTVVLLGIGALFAVKYGDRYWKSEQQKETSDAKDVKGTLHFGVDNWIGYYPLCSRNFKQKMRSNGYLIKCVDDSANLAQRFKALGSQELQFAVSTIDSYLANGSAANFPGTIVAVIDESKGGDAIIARTSVASSLDKLKGLAKARIAFTPGSPSEFLLHAASVHFDLQNLKGNKPGISRVVSKGAEDAYNQLLKGQVDIAVLWEPFVTKALANKDFSKILSTADTARLIVDVLLVNREYSASHPDVVTIVLRNYFRTLKYYRDNPDEFRSEMKQELALSDDAVLAMMNGVSWQTLNSNARNWFGISPEGETSTEDVVESIDTSLDVLKEAKVLARNPLPSENPYIILNKDFVRNLFQSGNNLNAEKNSSTVESFKVLTDTQWNQLQEVGTLRIRPISFQSGTNDLSQEGKSELEKISSDLKHYPHFRVIVKGHTGMNGDPEANLELSLARAQAVRSFLAQTLKFDENRIHAVGMGSKKPLPRLLDESDRALNYRLPRVELYLVSDVY